MTRDPGPAGPPMAVDRDYLIETCRALVRTNSVNPTLVPGAPGERAIAALVARRLEALGLEVTQREPEPGRVSVVGRLPGTGGGRSLMLNAHLDTVGLEGMPDPLSGEVRDGRLYGRGAYDMKGSLACGLAAVKALQDRGTRLRGDLVIAGVADEEYGSLGTTELLTHTTTDAAIVTEPTSLRVCLAHKGYQWITVRTVGRAAHGSRFEDGVDANLRMGRVLARLETLERDLRARPPHPLVGPPSLHAALLAGGTGLSTYAAECVLRIERRTVPGETPEQVLAEIQAILRALAADDPTFTATAEAFFVRQPFEVARTARIVEALSASWRDLSGRDPDYVGDTPWMDAALTAAAGIETVVFGPHGAGAHSAEEWVDLDSMVRCAAALAGAATRFCG